MSPQTSDYEVIDLSPPKEWLYKCDCPKCKLGSHYDKDIAESYRKRGKLNNEVARLREFLNRAIEAAEEAIRLADIDYENDKFGKVTRLKQEVAEIEKEARLAPAPEEPKNEN